MIFWKLLQYFFWDIFVGHYFDIIECTVLISNLFLSKFTFFFFFCKFILVSKIFKYFFIHSKNKMRITLKILEWVLQKNELKFIVKIFGLIDGKKLYNLIVNRILHFSYVTRKILNIIRPVFIFIRTQFNYEKG